MNFLMLFGILLFLDILSMGYFWNRFHHFAFVERIARKNKGLSWGIAFLPVFLLILMTILQTVNMLIILPHLLVVWLLTDLTGWMLKRKGKGKSALKGDVSKGDVLKTDIPKAVNPKAVNPKADAPKVDVTKADNPKVYWQGIAAILITLIYLGAGCYTAHHVVRTEYRVTSDKLAKEEKLRIVMLADSHLGTTFDGEGFSEHLAAIQSENPDILVITGDFVDDDSKKEDLLKACQALGQMKTTKGVYYVFGNHDKGYSNYRNFNQNDLRDALIQNGVRILEDEAVAITSDILLVGRQDKSTWSRATMTELMEKVKTEESEEYKGDEVKDSFTIILDHQPNDYDAQTAAAVDLVLSGHTHGGWLFPMGILAKYFGPDDLVYGMEVREKTTFIVTSGISDWALPFKTGTKSEYVVIDVVGEDS